MTGVDFRRLQLADSRLAPIPVIFMSAASLSAEEAQGALYLRKPFEISAFQQAMDRIVSPG